MQDKLQDFYYRQANRNIVHHFGDVHFQSITCSVTDKQVTCWISQGIVKKSPRTGGNSTAILLRIHRVLKDVETDRCLTTLLRKKGTVYFASHCSVITRPTLLTEKTSGKLWNQSLLHGFLLLKFRNTSKHAHFQRPDYRQHKHNIIPYSKYNDKIDYHSMP